MKKPTYHEVNPLVRIRELSLLSSETFQRLIQASDLDQVAQILQNTVYQNYLEEDFAYHFEQNLNHELEETIRDLIDLAPEKEVIWIYTMRYTFHNLKVLTKAEVLGRDYDYLCINDGFFEIDTLKSAIRTGISQLPETLMASINEAREYLNESTVIQGIDVIYDRAFLRMQREIGERLGYPELLDEIIGFIDLTNIVTAGRGIIQKRSQAFMTGVLSSAGSLDKHELLRFCKEDEATYVQYLLSSPYGELLQPALVNQTINFHLLEKIKDNYLTEHFVRANSLAFGPIPLLAYLNAKEVEIKNLRTIIVGKRSGFTIEEIQERMRLTYDL
ncbi:MAG TPA: V-type ATPase subunit [Enterococcus columbae]|nr:V-type ATPase subunit [Enterococcus columbae]